MDSCTEQQRYSRWCSHLCPPGRRECNARMASLDSGCRADPRRMVDSTMFALPSWLQTLPIHLSTPSCNCAFRGSTHPIPTAARMQITLRSATFQAHAGADCSLPSIPLSFDNAGGERDASEMGRRSS
eukprot:scaffold254226_cov36-Tisochrysis_lutea.AAC.2